MSDEKLSPELMQKIAKTELPFLGDGYDRSLFFNGVRPGVGHIEEHRGTFWEKYDHKYGEALESVPEGMVAVYEPLKIDKDAIPKDMRNIGVRIVRSLKTVEIDSDKRSMLDKILFERHDSVPKTGGYILSQERRPRVFLMDYCFFCKSDNQLDIKYAQRLIKQRHESCFNTLLHELKHIKNQLLFLHRPYASDYKVPTMEEVYKLRVEDERTATFSGINEAVKKYLKAGNYQDFSMFSPKMNWVVKQLKGKSDKEVKKLCYPPIKLMNKCLANWNKDYLQSYFEQVHNLCYFDFCRDSLLISTDATGKEFKKQRSMMYTYEVYNPYTGKNEMMDLSSAIEVDIPISDKVKKEIIEPCEEKRKKAKEELYALIPDKKTEILAANLAETLKREKMAQWLASSKNSDAEAILDRVRFAQPVKASKRNFIAKKIKMAMSRLPASEKALKYAAVISAFVTMTGAISLTQINKETESIETESISLSQVFKSRDMPSMSIEQLSDAMSRSISSRVEDRISGDGKSDFKMPITIDAHGRN